MRELGQPVWSPHLSRLDPTRRSLAIKSRFNRWGADVNKISVLCLSEASPAAIGAADIPFDGRETPVCGSVEMSVSAAWMDGQLSIGIDSAPVGASLLVLGATGNEAELGSVNVPIQGGKLVKIVEP